MAEQLSAETEKKMHALCNKISVSNNLDDEIRRELYGHIEDKMLSYMEGQEKLSEEEAFSLVSKHFGNPAEIKALFQNVHSGEVFVSFARKLGAIFALSFVSYLFFSYFHTFQRLFYKIFGFSHPEIMLMITFVFLQLITVAIPVIFLWAFLIFWRKKIINNEKVWFFKADPLSYIGILIFITFLLPLILITLFSRINTGVMEMSIFGNLHNTALNNIENMFRHFNYNAYNISQCVAWLWWFDTPPRRVKTMSIAFVLWFFYSTYFTNLIGGICVTFHNSPSQTPGVILQIIQNFFGIQGYITDYEGLFRYIVIGFSAWLIYYLWIKIRDQFFQDKKWPLI